MSQLNYFEALGLRNLGVVHRNLSVAKLVEHALARQEGILAANGALCVQTGQYTGRSPHDRFIVDEPSSHAQIHWNPVNVPISVASFERLYHQMLAYVQGRELFVFDGWVGADPQHRVGVRIINELASQNLFAHQMFLRPSLEELPSCQPEFTVIALPGLQGDVTLVPELNSETFIVLNVAQKLVLIGGSRYAGEIKKSVFSLMNYFMTERDVLPMHCSANMDDDGNTALFFGLSGTGKTSLSADPARHLIGDDEHGWSSTGVFNFEGGCYAKTIRLAEAHEPQIWSAIRFGALMENVAIDPTTRQPDYDDDHLTENTRVAYPVEHIPNCVVPAVGGHPKTVIFLTADAFGVLPPIAKLTPEQAMYHFISGYTSKLAGTERGITEPQAVFSCCFGKPFMPRSPALYAQMLGDRIRQHQTAVYLINTGWSGGPYGVGQRMAIQHTRAMVTAALQSTLAASTFKPHPIFKVGVPEAVPGVPPHLLDPRQTWPDPAEYDRHACDLAQRFIDNFQRFEAVAPDLVKAGPTITVCPVAQSQTALPI